MSKSFKGSDFLVLAAVKLTDAKHHALGPAAALCRRTGMRLRLISAVEVDQFSSLQESPYDMFDFTVIGRSLGECLRAQAEDELKALAAKLDVGTPVTTSVVVSKPAQAILSEATVSGAHFIITGAAKGSHQFVPKGMSTALSLMMDSTLPVMVVSNACNLDLTLDRHKILVADDLSQSSERAVLAAFDLAAALGHTDVHHVHVNALNIETFATGAQELIREHGSGLYKDLGPTEMWDEVQRHLNERMRRRVPNRIQSLDLTEGQYYSEVRNGAVESELERAIEEAGADILVFGRHHAIHRRPFAIGRVPFHFMLSQDRALIVIPE